MCAGVCIECKCVCVYICVSAGIRSARCVQVCVHVYRVCVKIGRQVIKDRIYKLRHAIKFT